ncbi:MAG TPA: LysM domain-containing protein [Opitutaceae bacterium]|jgi:LysM repeat protein
MDTISRENTSIVPMIGAVVGALGLIVGLYAAVTASSLKKIVHDQADKIARIDDIAAQVTTAQGASDKAARDIASLQSSTQGAVTQIAQDLAGIHEQLKHMEEVKVAPRVGKGKGGEPAVAGPGEYIVKSGDSGARIARANGCSLADLESVNAGVSWTHLKVGQKLKLPEKK